MMFSVKNKHLGLGKCYYIKNFSRITMPMRVHWNLDIRPSEYRNVVIRLGEYTVICLFALDIKMMFPV